MHLTPMVSWYWLPPSLHAECTICTITDHFPHGVMVLASSIITCRVYDMHHYRSLSPWCHGIGFLHHYMQSVRYAPLQITFPMVSWYWLPPSLHAECTICTITDHFPHGVMVLASSIITCRVYDMHHYRSLYHSSMKQVRDVWCVPCAGSSLVLPIGLTHVLKWQTRKPKEPKLISQLRLSSAASWLLKLCL